MQKREKILAQEREERRQLEQQQSQEAGYNEMTEEQKYETMIADVVASLEQPSPVVEQ